MIVPAEIRRKYDSVLPAVKVVAERVRETLTPFCEEHGYPFVGRTKGVESLAEKIESGRFKTWSELDDLYACTVVVPMLSEEDTVLGFLRKVFDERQCKNRGSSFKSPQEFRFDATRFIGTLKPPPQLDPTETHKLRFEVQIRSAFEHAWSAATHALVYKSTVVDWKRLRAAAQMKAAVEQLDALVLAFDANTDPITEHRWPDTLAQSLAADRMKALVDEGLIPPELCPKDWTRFAENYVAFIKKWKRPRREAVPDVVRQAVETLESGVRGFSSQTFPRSISLLQLALAILIEAEPTAGLPENFVLLKTNGLSMHFPSLPLAPVEFDFDA